MKILKDFVTAAICFGLASIAIFAQTRVTKDNLIGWQNSNPVGFVSATTIYATGTNFLSALTLTGSVMTVDPVLLFKNAPSNRIYQITARFTATNGELSDLSTNMAVEWYVKPRPNPPHGGTVTKK